MHRRLIAYGFVAVISLLPVVGFAAVEISDGSVIALWHLDGDSVDASGNGYNGTDTGMTYPATAKLGTNSARFDGNTYPNNNASVSASLAGIGSNFTINFWVLASSTSSGDKGLVSMGHWSGTGDLAIDNNNDNGASDDNKLAAGVYNNTPDTQSNSAYWTTALVNTNSWNMITVIQDSVSSKIRILVNGVEDKNTTLSVLNALASESETYLGTFKVGTNYRGFNGYLDEVMITNNVVGTTTLASIYNSGFGNVVCTSSGCASSSTPSSTTTLCEGEACLAITEHLYLWLVMIVFFIGFFLIKKLVW